MGLFSSSKSNLAKTSDKVWKTREACLMGMVTEALASIKRSEAPIIISFFEESNKKVTGFLDSLTVPYQTINSFSGKDAAQQNNNILVIDAAQGRGVPELPRGAALFILFFGHYPLLSVETKFLEALQVKAHLAKISFCLSLEDPFFELLGAAGIRSTMEGLGMKDDECIEHPMVSKAIHRAMEKLNEKIETEIKAHSEREWFSRNIQK